jgi:hypothetical protein
MVDGMISIYTIAVFVLKNHLYNMDLPPKPLFYHADVLEPRQDEANEAPL